MRFLLLIAISFLGISGARADVQISELKCGVFHGYLPNGSIIYGSYYAPNYRVQRIEKKSASGSSVHIVVIGNSRGEDTKYGTRFDKEVSLFDGTYNAYKIRNNSSVPRVLVNASFTKAILQTNEQENLVADCTTTTP